MGLNDWARQMQGPAAFLLAFAVAALIGVPLVEKLLRPTFDSLKRIDATLTAPFRVGSYKGTHVAVITDKYEGRIERVCLLWDCDAAAHLPNCKVGTHVSLWVKNDEIWQMEVNGRQVLGFYESLDSYNRLSVRFVVIMSCFVVVIGLLYFWMRRINARNMAGNVSERISGH